MCSSLASFVYGNGGRDYLREGLHQSSILGQAVNVVANLKLNPTVGTNEVLQVVFVNKVLGYVGPFDAYIFRSI